MPRASERQKRINDSAASLNRLRKDYVLLLATKAPKTIINSTFKVHALQCVNYVKLVNNRYLEPRGKCRKHKGKSVFMRHLRGKVGQKKHMNDKESSNEQENFQQGGGRVERS